jgi:hypothetical protein
MTREALPRTDRATTGEQGKGSGSRPRPQGAGFDGDEEPPLPNASLVAELRFWTAMADSAVAASAQDGESAQTPELLALPLRRPQPWDSAVDVPASTAGGEASADAAISADGSTIPDGSDKSTTTTTRTATTNQARWKKLPTHTSYPCPDWLDSPHPCVGDRPPLLAPPPPGDDGAEPSTGETIFVSIASFRDSECQHTLRDLFETAQFPRWAQKMLRKAMAEL